MTDAEKYRLSLYETIEHIKKTEDANIDLVRSTLEDRRYVRITYHSDKREIFAKIKSIESENLPKINEIFWNEDTIVIEEYIEGRNLEDFLKDGNISRKNVKKLTDDILRAVKALHTVGIVHRDIKPANIVVVNNRRAVLIDFGIARIYSPKLKNDTNQYGTVGYAPPEQYGFSQSSFKSDIYAVGITIREITEAAHDKQYDRLIRKCTEFDPGRRPDSVNEVIKIKKQENAFRIAVPLLLLAMITGCLFFIVLGNKNNAEKIATDVSKNNGAANTVIDTGIADADEDTENEADGNHDYCRLMDIEAGVADCRCISVSADKISKTVSLGRNMDKVIIRAYKQDNEITLLIGDGFKETFTYDKSLSSSDYAGTSFDSEIVLYDLNSDGIDEIITVIADAYISNGDNPAVLKNGTMAWIIGYDGNFYRAEGDIKSVLDPLKITETTPDCIWGEFPKYYVLENKRIIERE